MILSVLINERFIVSDVRSKRELLSYLQIMISNIKDIKFNFVY